MTQLCLLKVAAEEWSSLDPVVVLSNCPWHLSSFSDLCVNSLLSRFLSKVTVCFDPSPSPLKGKVSCLHSRLNYVNEKHAISFKLLIFHGWNRSLSCWQDAKGQREGKKLTDKNFSHAHQMIFFLFCIFFLFESQLVEKWHLLLKRYEKKRLTFKGGKVGSVITHQIGNNGVTEQSYITSSAAGYALEFCYKANDDCLERRFKNNILLTSPICIGISFICL